MRAHPAESNQPSAPTVRRFSTSEYRRMAELGFFADERVELLNGEIIRMSPQGTPHAVVQSLLMRLFERHAPPGLTIRGQAPFAVQDGFEPEPDVAIVEGEPRDFLPEHPTTALLVIEVADSSLAYDRVPKGSIYARANVQEYWVVNLLERVVERYLDPRAVASAPYGFAYTRSESLGENDSVTPLALPALTIRVADLLP